MAGTRRDNIKARKKRGTKALKKRNKRRKKARHYVGPWRVTFSCGKTDYQPMAASNEIKKVAKSDHSCPHKNCKPTEFNRLS